MKVRGSRFLSAGNKENFHSKLQFTIYKFHNKYQLNIHYNNFNFTAYKFNVYSKFYFSKSFSDSNFNPSLLFSPNFLRNPLIF